MAQKNHHKANKKHSHQLFRRTYKFTQSVAAYLHPWADTTSILESTCHLFKAKLLYDLSFSINSTK